MKVWHPANVVTWGCILSFVPFALEPFNPIHPDSPQYWRLHAHTNAFSFENAYISMRLGGKCRKYRSRISFEHAHILQPTTQHVIKRFRAFLCGRCVKSGVDADRTMRFRWHRNRILLKTCKCGTEPYYSQTVCGFFNVPYTLPAEPGSLS